MYDFDTIVDRRNTGCVKWDEARKNIIPMWVADMDFAVAPAIQKAVQERAAHPVYGYVSVPDAYYEAVTNWFKTRHDWNIEKESVIYTTGVVPAVSAILQATIQPGEKVIVQTPAYNCFFSCLRNSGAVLAENKLRRIPVEEGVFSYEIDFKDLENQCADPAARVLLLCNPYNPSGRCWTREELLRVAEICRRHDIFVISDEIHNELTAPGTLYTPWGTLGDEYQQNCAICVSASKSFNIAGLQIANIIVANAKHRARINKRININETCDVNPFGYPATIAAYNESGEWLDELREYIWENYRIFREFFANGLEIKLPVSRLEATYLVWVDITTLNDKVLKKYGPSIDAVSQKIQDVLYDDYGLWINAGEHYGDDGYLRFNIACPRAVMLEGLRRFASFVSDL